MRGMAVDSRTETIYWIDGDSINRTVIYLRNVEELIHSTFGIPHQIAIDPISEKMFWAGEKGVHSANLDGTNSQQVVYVETDADVINGLAIDVSAGKVYWGFRGGVGRADLDGNSIEDVLNDENIRPITIGLDTQRKKVYWGEAYTGNLSRINYNGAGRELLYQDGGGNGGEIRQIAIDEENREIYWFDTSGQHKMDVDGGNKEDIDFSNGFFALGTED